MTTKITDTIVVGAGQAGIAMSEHLSALGIDHIVFEKQRIAESWRTGRWDSLVANGPAWHDRFPNLEFADFENDAFVPKDAVADYFVQYSQMIDAPVVTGVEVTEVSPIDGRLAYRVSTSQGEFEARNIVVATGAFQIPTFPRIVDESDSVYQIHSSAYRNPDDLRDGAVLVVGAGSSGSQIAEELLNAGRDVYLSIGPHDRPPRSYRGRDFVWWLGVLGLWDLASSPAGKEHVTIAVSGADGGHTVDFRNLAERGMTLLGRTLAYDNGVLQIGDDLRANIESGDESMLQMLRDADDYVERNGLDLPEEPDAYRIGDDPKDMTDPILQLDLRARNIGNIVWATGFKQDFSWLKIDGFGENGRPIHQRGVSPVRGIYFLGLPWQTRRGSTFIWGVWHDAKFLADQIAIQKQYLSYPSAAANQSQTAGPSGEAS